MNLARAHTNAWLGVGGLLLLLHAAVAFVFFWTAINEDIQAVVFGWYVMASVVALLWIRRRRWAPAAVTMLAPVILLPLELVAFTIAVIGT